MTTPMRRQYLEQKARQPDAILFFRLGDFYETFDADAELTAAELGITLTSKPIGGGVRVPLAGVPVAHVESHLARLVARGHRVAICEQLEDPRATRGLVKRGVVRVVSPGTALEPALLEAGEPSACAALALLRDSGGWRLGLAALDLSTGACHALELRGPQLAQLAAPLAAELARLGAREVLLGPGLDEPRWAALCTELGAALGELPLRRAERGFGAAAARRALAARWGAHAAAALGLEERTAALSALGGGLELLDAALPGEADHEADQPERPDRLAHLAPPKLLEPGARLQWDAAAQRALAIVDGRADSGGAGERGAGHAAAGARSLPERRRAALAARRAARAAAGARADSNAAWIGSRRCSSVRRCAARRAKCWPPRPTASGCWRGWPRALAKPPELAALARGLLAAARLAEQLRASSTHTPDAPDASGAAALDALAERMSPAPEAARALAAALVDGPEADYGGGVLRAGVDAAFDAARRAPRRGAGAARGAGGRAARRDGHRRAEAGAITAPGATTWR